MVEFGGELAEQRTGALFRDLFYFGQMVVWVIQQALTATVTIPAERRARPGFLCRCWRSEKTRPRPARLSSTRRRTSESSPSIVRVIPVGGHRPESHGPLQSLHAAPRISIVCRSPCRSLRVAPAQGRRTHRSSRLSGRISRRLDQQPCDQGGGNPHYSTGSRKQTVARRDLSSAAPTRRRTARFQSDVRSSREAQVRAGRRTEYRAARRAVVQHQGGACRPAHRVRRYGFWRAGMDDVRRHAGCSDAASLRWYCLCDDVCMFSGATRGRLSCC